MKKVNFKMILVFAAMFCTVGLFAVQAGDVLSNATIKNTSGEMRVYHFSVRRCL